jgi:hypothetical protein
MVVTLDNLPKPIIAAQTIRFIETNSLALPSWLEFLVYLGRSRKTK